MNVPDSLRSRELAGERILAVGHPPEPWTVIEHGKNLVDIDHAASGSVLADVPMSSESARRIVACVNALADLDPEGIPGLVDAVEQIVGVLNAAKMQHGGEDSTNILSTLEGALRGVKP